eukprot:gene6164-12488_t
MEGHEGRSISAINAAVSSLFLRPEHTSSGEDLEEEQGALSLLLSSKYYEEDHMSDILPFHKPGDYARTDRMLQIHPPKFRNWVSSFFMDEHDELKPAYRNMEDFVNLNSAVRSERLDAVRFLIKKGADVNVADELGMFPLRLAFLKQNVDCMKLLIEHGADVNITITEINSPLLRWCMVIQLPVELIQLIIDKGANVNFVDAEGVPLLGWCITQCDKNPEYARLLIENGADVNAIFKVPYLSLISLPPSSSSSSSSSSSLLSYFTNVVFIFQGKATMIDLAICVKNLPLYRFLIQHGAKITKLAKVGLQQNRAEAQIKADQLVSPSSWPQKRSMTTTFKMNSKSNTANTKSNRYRTALSKACTDGDLEVAFCLVMMGADPWCAGLCADTGKVKPSPWASCNVVYREELERVWKRYVFITLSVVEACGDNLFKRIKGGEAESTPVKTIYIEDESVCLRKTTERAKQKL